MVLKKPLYYGCTNDSLNYWGQPAYTRYENQLIDFGVWLAELKLFLALEVLWIVYLPVI